MSTKNEKSQNNLYLVWNEERNIYDIITYRNNVIEKIQEHAGENIELKDFSSTSVTDERFKEFINVARKEGYIIYKLNLL